MYTAPKIIASLDATLVMSEAIGDGHSICSPVICG
jgi:hypothetical protein